MCEKNQAYLYIIYQKHINLQHFKLHIYQIATNLLPKNTVIILLTSAVPHYKRFRTQIAFARAKHVLNSDMAMIHGAYIRE